MKKEDWIGFILAGLIFFGIEMALGTFNLLKFVIQCILVLALWNIWGIINDRTRKN